VRELVEIAGGKMVITPGARVTDVEIARAKPEAALRNPAWKDVPAVKAGRVVVIRDELLNTPGPPLAQGVQALFRAIHPPAQSSMRD